MSADKSSVRQESLIGALLTKGKARLSKQWQYKVYLLVECMLYGSEPILVGFRPVGITFQLQIAVLAVSTVTFFASVYWTFLACVGEDELEEHDQSDILVSLVDGSVMFESVCLIFGWITIIDYPGISALRCIRMIRIAWLLDVFRIDTPFGFNPSAHVLGLQKFCQLLIHLAEKVGRELFTQQTRGSVVMFVLFFYVTYLFAVVFWNDLKMFEFEQDNDFRCSRLNECFIIMLRLAVYDNVGLDLLQQTVRQGLGGYAFLALLYVIITSFIVLNGIIGIFSRIIADDDNDDDDMVRIIDKHEDTRFLNGSVDRASQNTSSRDGSRPTVLGAGLMSAVITQPPRSGASHKNSDHRSIDTQELAQLVESLRAEVTAVDGKVSMILDLLEARHNSTTSSHSTRTGKKSVASHRILTKVDE